MTVEGSGDCRDVPDAGRDFELLGLDDDFDLGDPAREDFGLPDLDCVLGVPPVPDL